MRKIRPKYKRPKKMWSRERIETEKVLVKDYGLRKKKEIWKAQTLLRKYRRLARTLVARKDKRTEKEMIDKLSNLGILEKSAGLDDVLGLKIEDILNRRLQTVVHRLKLANTARQARQLIVHGHVAIRSMKVIYPSYMVAKDDEKDIKVLTKAKAEPKAVTEAKEQVNV